MTLTVHDRGDSLVPGAADRAAPPPILGSAAGRHAIDRLARRFEAVHSRADVDRVYRECVACLLDDAVVRVHVPVLAERLAADRLGTPGAAAAGACSRRCA